MVKGICRKTFFCLIAFVFVVFSAQVQATTCHLCKKLEACSLTIYGRQDYVWQVATGTFSPASPFTALVETTTFESEDHQLCQCCLSLCLAKNWNPETNRWKKDRCPVCHQEENCPIRPNLKKIQIICLYDPMPDQKICCPDDRPKILIIGNQRQLPMLIPEELLSSKLKEQNQSKLELRKDLVLGVVFLTDRPTEIDETIQAMILFGDGRVAEGLRGFYNSGVVVLDPETGRPHSYTLSAQPIDAFHKKHSLMSFSTKKGGIFYSKIIAIIQKPI